MTSLLQRGRLSRLLATVLRWAAQPDRQLIECETAGWSPSKWQLARQIIFMHGLGPHLHDSLRLEEETTLDEVQRLRQFLAAQLLANRQRIARMHRELAVILSEARRRRVAVMPLKGSLLGLRYYPDPALRPMADLDLLIQPDQFAALDEALVHLGYDRLPPDNLHAQERHYRYLKPDNRAVVSWTEEHPANPRPVEVHTSLRRLLWGDLQIPDLAPSLWDNADETEILGEPVWAPRPEELLAHLAAHTLDHMMVSTARGIQLLDLVHVSSSIQKLSPVPQPSWLYLPLRLAQRAFPQIALPADLDDLGDRTDPDLRHWAQTVALGGSCGLVVDSAPRSHSRWWVHWERWAASRWRLRLAYGQRPLLLAAVSHLALMARQLGRRLEGQRTAETVHPDDKAGGPA